MVLIWPPDLATTMWDLVGWLGVAFGLLYPLTPARVSRGSFFAAMYCLYFENHSQWDVVNVSYGFGVSFLSLEYCSHNGKIVFLTVFPEPANCHSDTVLRFILCNVMPAAVWAVCVSPADLNFLPFSQIFYTHRSPVTIGVRLTLPRCISVTGETALRAVFCLPPL